VALRVVGLEQPDMMAEIWDMARATNLNEFEAALKRLQLPMFNIIYSDDKGHILYLFNAQVPIHSQGNWNYWRGIVPGDTSTTLWTKTHPYRDLPRVLDPPSGWLQNTNDPPWTTTFPKRSIQIIIRPTWHRVLWICDRSAQCGCLGRRKRLALMT
jgi:acyl-homoserine-lactone acylase